MADFITCPICGKTSHHPDDIRHGYCGGCHAFTAECAFRDGKPGAVVLGNIAVCRAHADELGVDTFDASAIEADPNRAQRRGL